MTLNQTIAVLKRRKRVKIREEENPTYNVILMSHKMSKDFLDEIRKRKELEDIKTIHISKKGLDLNVKVEASLPANSVIFMKDGDPVAAWIGGRIKLMTKRKK